jgi:hypothetical protein
VARIGKNATSVSKKTAYVVAGDFPGSVYSSSNRTDCENCSGKDDRAVQLQSDDPRSTTEPGGSGQQGRGRVDD